MAEKMSCLYDIFVIIWILLFDKYSMLIVFGTLLAIWFANASFNWKVFMT